MTHKIDLENRLDKNFGDMNSKVAGLDKSNSLARQAMRAEFGSISQSMSSRLDNIGHEMKSLLSRGARSPSWIRCLESIRDSTWSSAAYAPIMESTSWIQRCMGELQLIYTGRGEFAALDRSACSPSDFRTCNGMDGSACSSSDSKTCTGICSGKCASNKWMVSWLWNQLWRMG